MSDDRDDDRSRDGQGVLDGRTGERAGSDGSAGGLDGPAAGGAAGSPDGQAAAGAAGELGELPGDGSATGELRAARELAREAKAIQREAKRLERMKHLLSRQAKALARDEEREAERLEREAQRDAEWLAREAERLEHQAEQAEQLARDKAAQAEQRAQDKAREAEQRARDKAEQAEQRARDKAREAEQRARDKAERGRQGEHPRTGTDDPDDGRGEDGEREGEDTFVRRWERHQEQQWERFEQAWQRHAAQRERWAARRARRGPRWGHRRWKELHEEREMWLKMAGGKRAWGPWWLQARMRKRIFLWLAVAVASGAIGMHFWPEPRWWHAVVALVVLSVMSGGIAFRLTRPLLMVVRVAQDIGDGKLETRLDIRAHRFQRSLPRGHQ